LGSRFAPRVTSVDGMKRRFPLLSFVPLAVAGVLALTGCATSPTPAGPFDPEETGTATPTDQPLPAGEPGQAIELVGMWSVTGLDEDPADTFLRIDAREVLLFTSCGVEYGSWRVAGTDLLMSVGTAAAVAADSPEPTEGECAGDGVAGTVPWVDSVDSYSAAGDGSFTLLDDTGEPVATLVEDGAPKPAPNLSDDFLHAPEITEDTRAWFVEGQPLPADATAATDLVGRWIPTEKTGDLTDPFVTFAGDGSYEASDGCNGGAGRWKLGADGVFLATSGPSTLMFCEGAAVPLWISQATIATSATDAAGLGTVTLLDATGTTLGALVRG